MSAGETAGVRLTGELYSSCSTWASFLSDIRGGDLEVKVWELNERGFKELVRIGE